MRRPGVIPPGRAGLFLLAAALVPVALKEAKPLVRAVGRGFRRLGDMFDKMADEPLAEPVAEPTTAEDEVAEPKPKKRKKKSSS